MKKRRIKEEEDEEEDDDDEEDDETGKFQWLLLRKASGNGVGLRCLPMTSFRRWNIHRILSGYNISPLSWDL